MIRFDGAFGVTRRAIGASGYTLPTRCRYAGPLFKDRPRHPPMAYAAVPCPLCPSAGMRAFRMGASIAESSPWQGNEPGS
jgi:hypothetical protein